MPDDDNVVPMNQKDREASADFDPVTPPADDDADRDVDPDATSQFVFDIPSTGRKVNLGTLVPKGTPIKIRYKMSGKSIPNIRGGLMDPADTTALLLCTVILEDVDVKFTRDSDLKITEATVYLILAPRDIVNARSEAGAALLGEQQAA